MPRPMAVCSGTYYRGSPVPSGRIAPWWPAGACFFAPAWRNDEAENVVTVNKEKYTLPLLPLFLPPHATPHTVRPSVRPVTRSVYTDCCVHARRRHICIRRIPGKRGLSIKVNGIAFFPRCCLSQMRDKWLSGVYRRHQLILRSYRPSSIVHTASLPACGGPHMRRLAVRA